jgi:hypothetical protein
MASTFHRALLLPRPAARGPLVAAVALSWALLQVIGEQKDLVPIAAHLLGLLILLAVALAVLEFARREEVAKSVAARAAA